MELTRFITIETRAGERGSRSHVRFGNRARRPHRGATSRPGAVMVAIIAALVICTTIVSMTLQSALQGRRETRLAHQRTQVEFLAEAGMQRAVSQLGADPQYTGEIWRPRLDVSTYSLVEVEIKVQAPERQPAQREVIVRARLDAVTHNFGPLQHSISFQTTINDN